MHKYLSQIVVLRNLFCPLYPLLMLLLSFCHQGIKSFLFFFRFVKSVTSVNVRKQTSARRTGDFSVTHTVACMVFPPQTLIALWSSCHLQGKHTSGCFGWRDEQNILQRSAGLSVPGCQLLLSVHGGPRHVSGEDRPQGAAGKSLPAGLRRLHRLRCGC